MLHRMRFRLCTYLANDYVMMRLGGIVLFFRITVFLLLVLSAPLGFSSLLPLCSAAPAQLTANRFAIHTDAVSGDKKLRIVLDLTAPLEATANLSGQTLSIDLPGASLSLANRQGPLDGRIALKQTLSTTPTGSRLTITLPEAIESGDFNLFTLPANAAAGKPFRVVLDINEPAQPARSYQFTPGLKGKVIVLDPGHGGSDPGAIGPAAQVMEKDVTLAISLKVKDLLTKAGSNVILTRSDDRDVFGPNASGADELGARAAIGNRNNADVFIDIHANSFRDPSVGGTATYYYGSSSYSRLLAQSVQSAVTASDGLSDRGVYTANFYVLRRTLMPAVLLETAFLTNPSEEALLNNPQFQQKVAQGIVNGITNFFSQAATTGR